MLLGVEGINFNLIQIACPGTLGDGGQHTRRFRDGDTMNQSVTVTDNGCGLFASCQFCLVFLIAPGHHKTLILRIAYAIAGERSLQDKSSGQAAPGQKACFIVFQFAEMVDKILYMRYRLITESTTKINSG